MTSATPPTPATPSVVPDDAALFALLHRSHEIITTQQHASGAYPACPTFSAYAGYAWLRDGSFTAEGISRYGDAVSAERFHDWACEVLLSRREHVAALVGTVKGGGVPPVDEMLPTRFRLDGSNGADPWWDFQTDGFGMWLWAVTTHARRHGVDLGRWRAGIEVGVDYLSGVWHLPCYDWWEEHIEHRHVSTLGAIYGGLSAITATGILDAGRQVAASDTASAVRALVLAEGVRDGHLTKWLGTAAVDGSLPACIVPFGVLDPSDPIAVTTLRAVTADLDVAGGVHRFREDVFYGGGQWPLLSALLGWNQAAAGDHDAAAHRLRWVAAQVTGSGELPEQVDHHLLAPRHRSRWIERWGTVATPLLWSHGMYLILADELGLTTRGAAS